MFEHVDLLRGIDKHQSIEDKFDQVYQAITQAFPFIVRISVVLYDSETDILKTYLSSRNSIALMKHYQTSLDNAPSLKKILVTGSLRIVNDLSIFDEGTHEHRQRIRRQGLAASYTMPICNAGETIGFLFFNSTEKNVFTKDILKTMDIYGHLIAGIVVNELASTKILQAALKTTTYFTCLRDAETGSHLDRMSRYSRLIAESLAERYQLDDVYIENIFMYSPLHDIGKIAIPDTILLKPGPLDEDEWTIMRVHTRRGREMIEHLVSKFSFGHIDHIHILRNIIEYHHEAIDGSGYPDGKRGDEIPLEARIVAVADVFDALTSRRPHKEAWSNKKAFDILRQLAGKKLDLDCVNALITNQLKVVMIQSQFRESFYG